MTHTKCTWFWLSLFLGVFELGLSQAQILESRDISLPGKLPSKYELDLIFGLTRNRTSIYLLNTVTRINTEKLKFNRQINYAIVYATPDFIWSDLLYNRDDALPVDSQISNSKSNNHTRNKSYSLYYMPNYDEINVVLPKSRQVLNYFLTLGSSLYVTSKQSGR